MKLAIAYAGQGSQYAGMGKDFYENNETFRRAFDEAAAGADFDLKELCFEDPDGKLTQTEYTQPALVAFGSAVNSVLSDMGILQKADYLFGLSLGEYTALQGTGVWTAPEATAVAAFRGAAMARAAEGIACGMDAIVGLDREALQKITEEATETVRARHPETPADRLSVWITNDNCPGQMVISGDSESVETAGQLAAAAGARVLPLQVSGPFHTPWMAPAGEALKEVFRKYPPAAPKIPVVHNYTARPQAEGETIPDLLVAQVQNGVRMRESIDFLLDVGVDTFIEIGPGHTVTGFVKKAARARKSSVTTCVVEKTADLEKLQEAFA